MSDEETVTDLRAAVSETPASEPPLAARPTRVLLVSHHAPPHVGGVETLVDLEARALDALGCDVTWVASRPTGEISTHQSPDYARLVRVPAWHILERKLRVAYPLFSPSLVSTLWREVGRADVVHVHGLVFLSSWLALQIAWLRRKPSVLTDHGGLLKLRSSLATFALRMAVETMGRMSCRAASRLVAYNATVHQLLARLAGTDRRSLFLPNPVDQAMFFPPTDEQRRAAREKLGWPADRKIVLFVGRFVEHKGMNLLLGAQHPGYDLAFCGSGEWTWPTGETTSKIHVLGARPQAEMPTLYHAADLLALPSYNEGFPVVIQEALTCGLPVVTSDDEAYRPYRGTRGLHFCRLDSSAVREAILQAFETTPAETLRRDRRALRELFPTRPEWLEKLFAGLTDLHPENMAPNTGERGER